MLRRLIIQSVTRIPPFEITPRQTMVSSQNHSAFGDKAAGAWCYFPYTAEVKNVWSFK